MQLLIDAGADLAAPGMDGGTPLHQAAWFGQPANLRLLIAAGAPLHVYDETHDSSPLGWAVHGSRWSGGADEDDGPWVESVTLLLAAGARPRDAAALERFRRDGSARVAAVLARLL